MTDPWAAAPCRQPTNPAAWWLPDAPTHQQTLAATLCTGCPALTPCDQYRRTLGPDAAGTYAGHYQPLVDHETDTQFLEIAAALGWDTPTPTPPAPIECDNETRHRFEQLTLWGPSVDASRVLYRAATRRRSVRPGRRATGDARTPDRVDA